MKLTTKLLAGAALLASSATFSAPAMAMDELTLQLKWVTQAQFAGYYVALHEGLYEAENLDVTINPGGPDIAPPQVIAGGGADVVVEWMPAALAARERGVPLVNIAQVFQDQALMLVCPTSVGVASPDDFPGRTMGVWFFGNEYPFLAWMSALGIPTEGGDDGVSIVRQAFNMDPVIQGQVDCGSTMIYNEYWQLIDAGYAPDDLVVFRYADQGMTMLEDGLYVLEESLEDPEMVDKLTRFVRASLAGWSWAQENPEEAAMIVLEYDETGAQTEAHQVRMMGEVNGLTGDVTGILDVAAAEATVDTLLAGGDDPAITMRPEGAWTTVITDGL
ncbi:MAG: ABC transporter substrate-binding protein [Devosiaceae bacterium]|nr:ABC transporter substrate-binding protein [Devosiaceae bacterium MH13]